MTITHSETAPHRPLAEAHDWRQRAEALRKFAFIGRTNAQTILHSIRPDRSTIVQADTLQRVQLRAERALMRCHRAEATALDCDRRAQACEASAELEAAELLAIANAVGFLR